MTDTIEVKIIQHREIEAWFACPCGNNIGDTDIIEMDTPVERFMASIEVLRCENCHTNYLVEKQGAGYVARKVEK